MATTSDLLNDAGSTRNPSSLGASLRGAFPDEALRPSFLALASSFGLLGLIYAANLRHFVFTWSNDENYSHGFLVPLLSLYFARESLRRGPIAAGGGTIVGIVLIGMSILARLATIIVPVGMVGDGGFLLGIAGICALLAGADALRRFGFAIGFLAFMIPLPVAMYTTIASPLQQIVTRLGGSALGSIGIPVLCEGNMMTLPGGVQMFVAEACSGMRQLTGFLALTTAVAYLSSRPVWYRGLLIASSIPIAMTANVLRVTLTGVVMAKFDPKYASGHFHTLEGLMMMAVGLGLLALECAALNSLTTPSLPSPQPRPVSI